jgi:RNA polymerase sigma-70 factor (ECF subfamily)
MKRPTRQRHLTSVDPNATAVIDGGATHRLLERVAARDKLAFTRLVTSLDRDLLRVAFMVAHDAEAARDAVQTTWQRVWSNPPALRDPGALRSWLLKVAANEARQATRSGSRARAREQTAGGPAHDRDPASGIELLDLRAALETLAPADRELLALRYVLDMTSGDIGAHLGLTAEGARSRLYRLLHRLREVLSDA